MKEERLMQTAYSMGVWQNANNDDESKKKKNQEEERVTGKMRI